jgi:hypothetical protein
VPKVVKQSPDPPYSPVIAPAVFNFQREKSELAGHWLSQNSMKIAGRGTITKDEFVNAFWQGMESCEKCTPRQKII